METIDTKYDIISKTELEKQLKRPATPAEIINSDNDTNLVTETLWQLIKELEERISILEAKK